MARDYFYQSSALCISINIFNFQLFTIGEESTLSKQLRGITVGRCVVTNATYFSLIGKKNANGKLCKKEIMIKIKDKLEEYRLTLIRLGLLKIVFSGGVISFFATRKCQK